MLTFVCGWRSADRDYAIIKQRASERKAIFFVDNQSAVSSMMPDALLIDVWRNGRVDFQPSDTQDTVVRVNYDTENELIQRAVAHVLFNETNSQIIVTYDAVQGLSRLFPALRSTDALLTADERFDAPPGDHIVFTRGGSFRWIDRALESHTVLLTNSETYDGGIVPDDIEYIYPAADAARG